MTLRTRDERAASSEKKEIVHKLHAHFYDNPKILFQYLFAEKYCFYLPGLQYSELSQARSALKIGIHRVQQRPACNGKRTAVFLLVGQLPLYACTVASVLWESFPVTRSPSCGRFRRPPPTYVVSSSTRMLDWTDHGANTTKMRWQQRQKDQINERSGFCHLGRHGNHFSVPKAVRRPAKKANNSKIKSIFLRSHNSVDF